MSTKHASILLVDDDESLRRVTEHQLTQEGHRVTTAKDAQEALTALQASEFDLVITDLRMPGMDGLALLKEIRRRVAPPPVIVVTAHAAVETAVEAMKSGASDYIAKPFSRDELRVLVNRTLELHRLERENAQLRETLAERAKDSNLIGESPAFSAILKMIGRLGQSDSSVLIEGESGTGKELVARAIHFGGTRRAAPFVAVNCSAIPRELLESVLFGHLKGTFTGATEDREGKFEAAQGGTLFLDEIGDMPQELQAKILRVLQEHEVERVGSNTPIPINVRVIAATNRNLAELVESGQFRSDLFYRLNVVPLRLPPLRRRAEDIPILVRHFLGKLKAGQVEPGPELLERLMDHEWPGNVRELENLIERMLLFRHDESRLGLRDLPTEFGEVSSPKPSAKAVASFEAWDIPEGGLVLDDVEKHLLLRALDKTGGNKSNAARLLGITRSTLLYRLQKHGIDQPS